MNQLTTTTTTITTRRKKRWIWIIVWLFGLTSLYRMGVLMIREESQLRSIEKLDNNYYYDSSFSSSTTSTISSTTDTNTATSTKTTSSSSASLSPPPPAYRPSDAYTNQTLYHNDHEASNYPNFTFRIIISNPIETTITTTNNNNTQDWRTAPQTSTVPWANLTTIAFEAGYFTQGFRNQIMSFVTFVLWNLIVEHHGQILLESLQQEDYMYSNQWIPFETLWDVEYWNSFFPKLPRLVHYDPILHSQWKNNNHNNHNHNHNNNHTKRNIMSTKEFPWYKKRKDTTMNTTTTIAANNNNNANKDDDFEFWTDFTNVTRYDERAFPYTTTHDQYWFFQSYYREGQKDERFIYHNTKNDNNDDNDNNNNNNKPPPPHPTEILILTQALRPHKELRDLMQTVTTTTTTTGGGGGGKDNNNNNNNNNNTNDTYMVLHARVEPDMQQHPVCVKKKVRRLTDIFNLMQAYWKDGPPAVNRIFMPINRKNLQDAADRYYDSVAANKQQRENKATNSNSNSTSTASLSSSSSSRDALAADNLRALNDARRFGLWNGSVTVFEFGTAGLIGTKWEDCQFLVGSLVDYFLSLEAPIFVGTEISSFSHNLMTTRFYYNNHNNDNHNRRSLENYKYVGRPQRLVKWTTDDMNEPPGFAC